MERLISDVDRGLTAKWRDSLLKFGYCRQREQLINVKGGFEKMRRGGGRFEL